MWLFRTQTYEELKNRAFQRYVFKLTPVEQSGAFRTLSRDQLADWSHEFSGIVAEIEDIVETERRFNYKSFVMRMSNRFSFMDKKSIDKAGWYGSQYAWRQGYPRN